MSSRLDQLSHNLAASHAGLGLARIARQQDAARRRTAGFCPWLLDLIGWTAAAEAQRCATSRWKVAQQLARDYAIAWVQARTVYLGTLRSEDAAKRELLQRAATALHERVDRATKIVDLVDQACRHANQARAACEASARLLHRGVLAGSESNSRPYRVSSGWKAAAAKSAVARTQAALAELQTHVPTLNIELRVKIPQGLLALIGSGNALGSFIQTLQLRSAAKHCKEVVKALAEVRSALQAQQRALQAEHRGAVGALANYDAPHRQRALGELPENMRAIVD